MAQPDVVRALPVAARLRCAAYAVIAAVAFVATWSQNLAYQDAAADFFSSFWRETRLTPAARSVTVDLLLFAFAAALLMVTEARRYGVRYVYAYIVGGLFIGISVTFPLFLIARELRAGADGAPALPGKDTALLAILALVVLAGTGWVLAG